jgi:MFS family permease
MGDPFYGYTHDGPFYTNLRFEPAVGFTAIGVGSASCIVAGLVLISRVRSRRLVRGWAVVLLIVSSLLATILPHFLVRAVLVSTRPVWREPIEESLKGVHLFQGEHGWWLFIAPYYAFWIALVAFIVFVICVFSVKRYDVA